MEVVMISPSRLKSCKASSRNAAIIGTSSVALLAVMLLATCVAGPPDAEGTGTPENLIQIADQWFCGAVPHTNHQFAALADMGIRTLVSVDGSRPDLEMASKHGLRYVHIPIGYDGIDSVAAERLSNLSRTFSGRVYIHCHHGKHRGPAAAAVAAIAAGSIDHAGAAEVLRRAGTGREYAGLWRDVAAFQTPPVDAVLPDLVEVAQTKPLVLAMTQMDEAMRQLAYWQKNRWTTGQTAAPQSLAELTLVLQQGFRESMRDHRVESSPDMATMMTRSQQLSELLHHQVESNRGADADLTFAQITETCLKCHRVHRNQ